MISHFLFRLYNIEKTGGTYLSNILSELFNGVKEGGHQKFKKNHLSTKKYGYHKRRPTLIGTIRNPFDFYLSLWSYGCQGKGNQFSRHLKHDPDDAYLYLDSSRKDYFKKWLFLVINDQRVYKPFDIELMKKYDIGLLTLEFFYTYLRDDYSYLLESKSKKDFKEFSHILKIEEVNKTILPLMESLGLVITQQVKDKFKKNEFDRNKSNHKLREEYYDQEMIDLVLKKDWYIFEKFDYRF